MGIKTTLFSLLGLSPAKTEGAQADQSDRFTKVMSRMVSAINAGDYKRFQQDFGKQMLKAFPLDASKPFVEKLISDYGAIKSLDPPRITPPAQAIFPVRFERRILDIKLVLDGNDKIIGLWVLPHQADIPVPEKNSVSLGLPFEGKWFVAWGGTTIELNQHHEVPCQRYAFDFLVADESGKTHGGDGNKCEDYYAFGKKVLCPADGIVTDVITGVRDNSPPSMNEYSAMGNSVIIRHAEREVSVIAHFKDGSILVKPGEEVTKGQIIGLCGNSGNSSEPHIHYHLQNTPALQDGTGIQCFFDKVVLFENGKAVEKSDYSPVKSDILSQVN